MNEPSKEYYNYLSARVEGIVLNYCRKKAPLIKLDWFRGRDLTDGIFKDQVEIGLRLTSGGIPQAHGSLSFCLFEVSQSDAEPLEAFVEQRLDELARQMLDCFLKHPGLSDVRKKVENNNRGLKMKKLTQKDNNRILDLAEQIIKNRYAEDVFYRHFLQIRREASWVSGDDERLLINDLLLVSFIVGTHQGYKENIGAEICFSVHELSALRDEPLMKSIINNRLAELETALREVLDGMR